MGNALNARISIYNPPTADETGAIPHNVLGELYRTVRAKRMSTYSSEKAVMLGEDRKKTYKFKVRHDSGITEDMTVVFDGKAYDIKEISEEISYGRYLYLICERSEGNAYGV